MALPEFELESPRTLEEALSLLASPGLSSVPLAGGTDLVVLLKQGALSPQRVVSLRAIPELGGIREEEGGVALGGGTTLAEIEASPLLALRFPGVVDAARTMATVQIRNRATVAGNLATAAACADLSPILSALEGRVTLRAPSGERSLVLTEFFTGARSTAMHSGELLTKVFLPAPGPRSGCAFVKFGHRRGAQIAVASAAANLSLDEAGRVTRARLVLGAVAPVPLAVDGVSSLLGQTVEGVPLAAASAAAAAECTPISDIRGSEAFRRAVVAVISRQALELASRRAWEVRP